MITVDFLMAGAFNVPRDPRSLEYKAGCRGALEFRLNGKRIQVPREYRPGTAAFDAFCAGTDEGHRIWRDLMHIKSEVRS